uniref:Uncharacterized protein n=1 Tax=Panagrolaimus sp. JU765 TaxID=591449 RepID=A0AC34R8T3_9BILA
MPTRDGHHIAFANEPVEKGDRIPLLSENAFAMKMFTPDLINTTVLVFDKNGIPYDGEINKLVTFYFNLLGKDYENYSEVVQKSVATVVQPEYSRFSEVNVQRQLPLSEMENLALTDEESLDLPDDLLPVSENSEYQNEETDTEAPCDVRIILREDGFARMCCQKNQQTSYLKFMEDEEWIPMYLSLKTGFPVVGAETIKDMESHPESVVF